ncbi:MAG: DUF4430 domain-containing protein [Candidatus Berkelbacteria bacterium]|nr:DUF4430 domain-containing protein [Candidatus Berkelbacteria bacterium]
MRIKNSVIYKVILILVLGVGILGLAGCARKTETSSVEQSSVAQEKTIEYQGEDGKTVCDLLQAKYQVEASEGSMGMLVNSINGLKATDKEFWLYSVNDKPGEVACDKQETKTGDKVLWEYKGF